MVLNVSQTVRILLIYSLLFSLKLNEENSAILHKIETINPADVQPYHIKKNPLLSGHLSTRRRFLQSRVRKIKPNLNVRARLINQRFSQRGDMSKHRRKRNRKRIGLPSSNTKALATVSKLQTAFESEESIDRLGDLQRDGYSKCVFKKCKSVKKTIDKEDMWKAMTIKDLGEILELNAESQSSLTESSSDLTTPYPYDGGWSPWSEWGAQCSVTCDFGRIYRYRKCNNPKPQKDGKDCAGSKFEHKVCDTGISCPIRGGWSTWSKWSCSQTCGKGIGTRHRSCSNPEPSEGGQECEGPKSEKGECFRQECPGEIYTLSPDIVSEVSKHMKESLYSYVVKEGSTILLPCDHDLVNMVYRKYPRSVTEWRKNEQEMKMDSLRMEMEEENLAIYHVVMEDTGIYECRTIYAKNRYVVLSVATVVVQGAKEMSAVLNDPLAIECPLEVMSKYLSNVSRIVMHNKTVVHESKSNVLTNEPYRIEKTMFNHSGQWWCGVLSNDDGRLWIISSTLVRVNYPTPFFGLLLANPWKIAAVFSLIFIVFFVFGSCCTFFTTKAREHANEDYKRLKAALAFEYGIVSPEGDTPSDLARTDMEWLEWTKNRRHTKEWLEKEGGKQKDVKTKENAVDKKSLDYQYIRGSESDESIVLSDENVVSNYKKEHPKEKFEIEKTRTVPKDVIAPESSVESVERTLHRVPKDIEIHPRDIGKETQPKKRIRTEGVIAPREVIEWKSKSENVVETRVPVGIKDAVFLPHPFAKVKPKEEPIETKKVFKDETALEPSDSDGDDKGDDGDDEIEESPDESSRLLGDDYDKKPSTRDRVAYGVYKKSDEDQTSVDLEHGFLSESSGDEIRKARRNLARPSSWDSEEEKLSIPYDILAKLPEDVREEILRKIRNRERLTEEEIFQLEKEYKNQGRIPVSFRKKHQERSNLEENDNNKLGTRKKKEPTIIQKNKNQGEEPTEIIHVLPFKRSLFGLESPNRPPQNRMRHYHPRNHY